jgi:hypothetical protein
LISNLFKVTQVTLNPGVQSFVPNLNYAQEMKPFSLLSSISAIGLEIWSITKDIYFDNFLITDQEEVALDLAHQIFEYRNNLKEKSSVRHNFELLEDPVFSARDIVCHINPLSVFFHMTKFIFLGALNTGSPGNLKN